MMLKTLSTNLYNFILPNLCAYCGQVNDSAKECLCSHCLLEVFHIPSPQCPSCGGVNDGVLDICRQCLNDLPPWSEAASGILFEKIGREIIHSMKYNGNVALVRYLAGSMVDAYKRSIKNKIDFIVPVPMYWSRELFRGYNQAELLAGKVSKLLDLKYRKILKRTKNTSTQTALSKKERLKNMNNVFKVVDKKNLKDSTILLIDDVMTSGATLSACTLMLLESGAKKVSVLTAARG